MTVTLIITPVVKIFWFVCGPTCGCGEVFPVASGGEMICPRCGRNWGRAPIIGGDK